MPFQSHCAVRGIHDTDPSPHPMKRHRRNPIKDDATCRLAAILIAALAILSCLPAASAGPLYFACAADNDLFRVASENGLDPKRFDSPQAAVEAAGEGDGVLLLASGYPAKTTALDCLLYTSPSPRD